MKLILLAAGAAVLVAWGLLARARAKPLPDDLAVIPISRMLEFCALEQGAVSVALIDREGEAVRDLGEFDHPAAAVGEVQQACHSAKIRLVRITKSRPHCFVVVGLDEPAQRGVKAGAPGWAGAVLRSVN
ncbi:hypothetical protein [Pseudooceanicola nanhaiensis]|uniref:hypothetical protein n=1 Tax=Pseudooceanicola nanhaiensis TaxID=375761 RepID=UPI001CD3C0B5|nr:hypothetical protein [Pseudooceanicola nanhaiensis]MCA0919223.1 hypothetical protein [Pseudooceanicola nanhaiensis]